MTLSHTCGESSLQWLQSLVYSPLRGDGKCWHSNRVWVRNATEKPVLFDTLYTYLSDKPNYERPLGSGQPDHLARPEHSAWLALAAPVGILTGCSDLLAKEVVPAGTGGFFRCHHAGACGYNGGGM